MRFVIQRVTRACVKVEGKLEGAIGAGLLVLVGISDTDGTAEADYLADKLVNLRVFSDSEGRMNLSALDVKCGSAAGIAIYFVRRLPQRAQAEFRRRRAGREGAQLYEYVVKKVRETGLVTRNRSLSGPYGSGTGQRRAGYAAAGELVYVRVILIRWQNPFPTRTPASISMKPTARSARSARWRAPRLPKAFLPTSARSAAVSRCRKCANRCW